MKHNKIFTFFSSALFVLPLPGLSVTAYNQNSSRHCCHYNGYALRSTVIRRSAVVRKCNSRENEEEQILKDRRLSTMFLGRSKRNVPSGKSSDIIYEEVCAHPILRPDITSNNNQHLLGLSTLILFPFHVFW
jgi:hypothetical protein